MVNTGKTEFSKTSIKQKTMQKANLIGAVFIADVKYLDRKNSKKSMMEKPIPVYG